MSIAKQLFLLVSLLIVVLVGAKTANAQQDQHSPVTREMIAMSLNPDA